MIGMIDPREQPAYDALNALGIPYTRFEHDAAMTMADCFEIDAALTAVHCKNLFLSNRQGTEFFLLLIGGEKPFKTKDVSRQIGRARLSFGTAEQLMALLGLTPGSVSPMGLVHDAEKRVVVLIDREVMAAEEILVHPCVNTASIVLKAADLMRFIESRGNPIEYVDISTAAENS